MNILLRLVNAADYSVSLTDRDYVVIKHHAVGEIAFKAEGADEMVGLILSCANGSDSYRKRKAGNGKP